MPIRFRCAYCNQLMGIAHRKAGTVVSCPKCSGQVIVPNPESGGSPAEQQDDQQPAAPKNIFENSEIDVILKPASAPPPTHSPAAPAPNFTNLPLADIVSEFPSSEADPLHSMSAMQYPANGLYLSRAKLMIFSVVIALLLGLAFFIGMMVGGNG